MTGSIVLFSESNAYKPNINVEKIPNPITKRLNLSKTEGNTTEAKATSATSDRISDIL